MTERFCSSCGDPITRRCQSGLCQSCAATKRHAEGRSHFKPVEECSKNALRKRARKLFEIPADCECEEPKCRNLATQRHHIDENPGNNVESNIAFLCDSCHIKLHHPLSDWYQDQFGERNHAAKLTEADVIAIRVRYARGERQIDIGVDYGMSQGTISSLVLGKRWSHIPYEISDPLRGSRRSNPIGAVPSPQHGSQRRRRAPSEAPADVDAPTKPTKG